jgi:integrase
MAKPSKPWFRASKGSWYATVGGRKLSLGVRGRENAKAAKEAWHRLMANGPKATQKPKPEPTVAEVIDAYLSDAESRVKPETLRGYRKFLRPFSAEHGQLPASALTPTICESWSRQPQWSADTRNDILGTLVAAVRWAVRSRLIATNPIAGVKRPPKTSRGASTLLTPSEHCRLLDHASPHLNLFLRVLYATGARPGEVAAITAENFDAEAGCVHLDEHKTSHKGKRRTMYLPPEAVTLLNAQRQHYGSGFLLRNGWGRQWNWRCLGEAMRRLRERAGVPHAITYGYRHTFATDALSNGVPDAQVAELLGHSGTAMLHKHYSHLGAKAQALRNALGKVR